ncbi:MAG: RNA polymerase sigma-70 factor [Odoribacter sp.]|nr:RNA polymerase sigma-70 factor [Odoribacter sp.]
MDEQEAILGIKNGDKAAFEYLYRSYWSQVYNFTRLYISSTIDAEEIVQEVFVKLWEVRSFLNEDKNIRGFLFIVTRNIIFNQKRKSFNEAFYKMTVLDTLEESYNIEKELEASDLCEHIDYLISLLPPQQQEIFKLSRKEHLTYKEISCRLGISEKIVGHHISDVLKYLKKNLKLYAIFLSIH